MGAEDKKSLFESVPVGRAITNMAIPTVISQLINLIYSLADTFFIGQTGDSYKMASVTLAFTLFMFTIAISNLYGIGGGSLAARLMGQGRTDEARSVNAFSFYGAAGLALFYAVLIGVFMDPLLVLLGASDATIGYARQYTSVVVVFGGLPTILSAVGAHLLRNAGYSRQASLGLSGGGVLNIVLDPLFMFVLLPSGMEVFGAALATTLSNVASCIYMIVTICKLSRKAPVSVLPAHVKGVSRESIKALYQVGVPSAMLNGLFDVANIFLNNRMAAHGDLELAAIGIVMKAERLPNALNIGLCQGMLPIVAYNFSSGNHKRMQDTIKTARNAGILISIVSTVLFEILATPLVQIFMNTSNAEDPQMAALTIGLAAGFLRIRCLASILQFLNYHTSFCMQAMGDGRDTLLHAIVRQIVCYIPFMFLLDMLFGTTGLAWALVAGEFCGAVFALILLQLWLKKLAAKGERV